MCLRSEPSSEFRRASLLRRLSFLRKFRNEANMTDQPLQESPSESRRTAIYGVVAALSVALGIYTYVSNQPKESKDFEKVGQEFYPEFTQTDAATSLFVAKYFEDEDEVKTFEVSQVDGQWTIPSHYNYPADAIEQLARTAVSIMGIKREALVSRRAVDHEKLGVVDPLSEDVADRKGRGERITIKSGNEVLADYIIGDAYQDERGVFYVRAPDEKETFVAHVNVDLSTKFQDWIDTDLLKIDRNKLTEILVRKYSIDDQTGSATDLETVALTRDKFGTPWQMGELDPESEEVNHDAVKALVSELVDTKIIGVRPKPKGLTPSLGITREAAQNPILQLVIRDDLQRKGFQLGQLESGEIYLVAKEGSFFAITNEGILYELHFGDVFTGDLEEIEIGNPDDAAKNPSEAEPESEASGKTKPDEQQPDPKETETEKAEPADKDEQETQQSRYLFVKVSFDPTALGDEPTPPEAPLDPGPFDPDAPLSAPRLGESLLTPQQQFEQAQQQYEADLKQYEQAQKTYQEKLEAGQKKAEELSDRLGAWYYVVPAKNVEALRVSRADLVQPKGTDAKKEQSQQPPQGARQPQLPFTPEQLKLLNQN